MDVRLLRRTLQMLAAIPANRAISSAKLARRLETNGHRVTLRTLRRHRLELSRAFRLQRVGSERGKPYSWRWPADAPRVSVPGMDWPAALSRRIATRYEKLAQRFASFVALVAAFVWLT